MSSIRLHRFHGGLELEAHKAQVTEHPILIAPIPKWLTFPLLQRDGIHAKPHVSVGDRVLKGQVLAGGLSWQDPPIHASTSGRIHSIEDRPLPHRTIPSGPCIILESDGVDESIELQHIPDFRDHTPEALLKRIHEAGITGLGGAGFPAAVKLSQHRIETLILNGVECEPHISCDDSLLRERASEVLLGAEILRHILGAQTVLLAIENNMPRARDAVTAAIKTLKLNGINLVSVPAIYPSGSERQLIQILTGKEVPADGLPADIGIITQNVGTVAAIYRAITLGEPMCSRIVTVTGRGIHQPRNLEVRLGTPIADIIECCGGYTDEIQRMVLGGPMTGFAVPHDDLPVTKSMNAIIAAGPGEWLDRPSALPCIRCSACVEVCPANLLPQQLYWHAQAEQLDRALDHQLSACIECACCDLVCPSHIPLTHTFHITKAKVAARQRERDKAQQTRLRYSAHEARKEKEERERLEAKTRRKENMGKISSSGIQAALERAKQKRSGKMPLAVEPTESEES